jgi:hypothetical protein
MGKGQGHEHIVMLHSAIYIPPACLHCYLRSMYIYLSGSTHQLATYLPFARSSIIFSYCTNSQRNNG